MTKEEKHAVDSILDLVQCRYNINIRSKPSEFKEATDIAAYLISKHTKVKNIAIASEVGMSTKSNYVTKAVGEVLVKMNDSEFKAKIKSIEIELLTNTI